MQLYLDSFGAYLGVKNKMFWLNLKHHDAELIAVRDVHAVFLTKGVSVSTGAMMLAIENQIPMILLDRIGRSVGQVWGGQFGSIATIRKQQALFSTHIEGWKWIQQHILQKLYQQQLFLEQLALEFNHSLEFQKAYYTANNVFNKVQNSLEVWTPLQHDGDVDKIAATFRGWEGIASRHYFQCLAHALPTKYQFQKRSRRPAFDAFNSLINYLYGMLYSMVELALMKAGIDPYMGILHADEHQKTTMVFDMIEIYRHWAEQVAIDLCRKNKLPKDAFAESEDKGVWLESAGKAVVIPTFLNFMQQKIGYKKQVRKRITHIDLDALRFARLLKDFSST
ncbi:MAG: CRISPR-associated endonuclease Cas1 [Chitinophagales bacterium]